MAALRISEWFERLAFLPLSGRPEATPKDWGWPDYEEVWFTSREGIPLHGWLIHCNASAPKGVVVHAHGNAGNIGVQFIEALRFCLSNLWDVFMFDYRCFGLSGKGPLNRYSVVDDLSGATLWVKQNLSALPLAVLGQSIGGATAALAMTDNQVRERTDGLCLISAFADWNLIYADVLQGNPLTWPLSFPVAYLLISSKRKEPYEGLRKWSHKKPLLLIHGERDRIVPIRHLKIFLQALPPQAREKAKVLRIPQAGHNALGSSEEQGREMLGGAIKAWLEEILKSRN